MTHAYCASGVVQFSSKRSPVYEAFSERGALQERPGRTRADGVNLYFFIIIIFNFFFFPRRSAHRVKAKSGERSEGERQRKNFSFPIFRRKIVSSSCVWERALWQ